MLDIPPFLAYTMSQLLIKKFLSKAPEAEPIRPCLGHNTQDPLDFHSLNGGFTGNPSVFILSVL